MTLTVAVRMTGDASSLKSEAGSGASAITNVGTAATEATQAVRRIGSEGAQALKVVGAAAEAAVQQATAVSRASNGLLTREEAAAKKSKAESAAAAQAAAAQASAVQRAQEIEAAAIWAAAEREAAAVQRFKDALDPLAVTQRKVAEETAHLQQWLASGAITPEQYQHGITRLEQEMAALGHTAGVSAGQMSVAKRTVVMNLMDMAQVTAATGGDLRMLAAIAPDMFYGFRLMGGAIAAAATGIVALGLAIGGIVYAATAFSADQRAIQHAIDQTGGALGLSRDQFNDLAKTVAQSTGQSASSVRNYAAAAAASGQVAGAAIGKLAAVTRDWADLMDKDVDAAAADLTTMLADPVKALDMLAARFHNVTGAEREYIKSLQDGGRLGDAQVEILNRIGAAADGASQKVSGWTKFWRNFTQGFGDALDYMGGSREPSLDDKIAYYRNASETWQGESKAEATRKLSELVQQRAQRDASTIVRQQTTAANDNALAADKIWRQSIDPMAGREDLKNQRELFASAIAGLEAQIGPRTEAQEKALADLRKGLIASGAAYEGFLTEGQKAAAMADLNAQAVGVEASARAAFIARGQKELELRNSLLPPEEKARQIAAAGAQALAQQALARQVSIEKMALEAAAAERLANAVGGGAEATQAAERANMLAAEAATNGTARLGELAAAYDRVQAAKREQAGIELLQGLTQEYQAAQLLADAQGKGAAATAEANIQIKRAEMQAKGYSAEVIATAEAVMRLTEAERVRGNLAAIDKDQSRSLEQLNTELSLVGATTAERERQIALLELRHKLEDAGVKDVDAELQARMAVADAIAAKRVELSKAQEAAREWQRLWEHAAENIQDALAGAFKSALSGSITTFSDFKTAIIDLMKEMAAQIAAMLVFRPMVGGVVNAVGSALGFGSAAVSAGGGIVGGAQNAGAGIAAQAGGSFNPMDAAGLGFQAYSASGGSGMSGVTTAIDMWGARNLGLASPVSGGAGAVSGGLTMTQASQMASSGAGEIVVDGTGTYFVAADGGGAIPVAANSAGGITLSEGLGYAGAVVNNVTAFTSGNTAQKILTPIGTVIGAYFGGPIGAAIGSTAGNFIGSLFGGGKSKPKTGRVPGAAYRAVGIQDGEFVTYADAAGFDPRTQQTSNSRNFQTGWDGGGDAVYAQLAQPTADLVSGLNKVVDIFNLTIADDSRVVAALGGGWVDNPNHQNVLADYYGGRGNVYTDPQAMAVALLKDPGVIQSTGMLSTALRNSKAETIDDLGSDMEFAQKLERAQKSLSNVADVLGDLRKAAESSVVSGIKPMIEEMQRAQSLGLGTEWTRITEASIRKQFSELVPQDEPTQTEKVIAQLQGQLSGLKEVVSRLGLSITGAEIDGYEAQARAGIKAGFDKSIADQLLQLTDPSALSLRQWGDWANNLRREAQAAGAEMVSVEELISRKRLAILKDEQAAVERTGTVIKDWLEKQLLGDLSSLSTPAKLTEAQAQFGATVSAARGGDAEALASLTGKADALLTIARDMFASTADYAAMEQFVRSTVQQTAHDAGLPGFAIGTSSAPAGWAWVGERGKELVHFGGGETVLPASQSASIARPAETRELVRGQMEQAAEMRSLRRALQEANDRQDRTLAAVERLARKVAS